ncbi:MAG: class I SAM-dependent methyltransferase [Alphaproteobacteria bacterium]|jgi:SAM-dependent methyltransferase|nr:class I SAM-dependent methyltransferase [Alphaproteobacteria bacterium]MBT4084237.1 class I SAM-dependent methyltransferase [Alphaproteobacteria bacterium]MBT4546276.1 class I SAM-dependent methyltransferase [Alphaproteobacteria bacterium]
MFTPYDTIGVNYSDLRKPDTRIEKMIEKALGPAFSVLNVGAGTGSYEPADRQVTAIEPSLEMIRQRRPSSAPVIQGFAEDLPFDDNSFDASMAVLTVHHWTDKAKGLKEMSRVTRGRVVLLTFDPSLRGLWLADYFPELVSLDDVIMPKLSDYEEWLGSVEISTVPIPYDCADGFLYAYWRRPAAYLDPVITAAMSSFQAMENTSKGSKKLADDLESGLWAQRYSELLDLDEYDLGYRLVTTR